MPNWKRLSDTVDKLELDGVTWTIAKFTHSSPGGTSEGVHYSLYKDGAYVQSARQRSTLEALVH
jgi:hypothetical protein